MNLHPKKLFPEIDNYELLNYQVVTKRDFAFSKRDFISLC
jgi:hypothetical protein